MNRIAVFAPARRFAENGFTPLRRSAENGFTPLRRSAENGFTLVEVIVALFIFGLLASAGVSLLSFTVKAQAASTAVLADVSDSRRLSAILVADFGQALPRVSRDISGASRPAFAAGQGALLMAYVRGGSKPQYVEIRLDKGTLVRIATPFVDGAANELPMALETDVESIRLRFRIKGDWSDNWDSERTDTLPRAIELTITRRGEAPAKRLFLVGAGE